MTLEGQNPNIGRYSIIPRTLVFLLSGDRVLLIELDESKGEWAGKLNGIGGHLERGEHPLRSAIREAQEETGLTPTNLRLCGSVVVDTQQPAGIGMFIFVGEAEGTPQASEEGIPRWLPLAELGTQPLMSDLPVILPRALDVYRGQQLPFTGLYRYDSEGELIMELDLEEHD